MLCLFASFSRPQGRSARPRWLRQHFAVRCAPKGHKTVGIAVTFHIVGTLLRIFAMSDCRCSSPPCSTSSTSHPTFPPPASSSASSLFSVKSASPWSQLKAQRANPHHLALPAPRGRRCTCTSSPSPRSSTLRSHAARHALFDTYTSPRASPTPSGMALFADPPLWTSPMPVRLLKLVQDKLPAALEARRAAAAPTKGMSYIGRARWLVAV